MCAHAHRPPPASLTLALAALGTVTACGGADAIAGPRPVVGRFTLRTLEGGPLPVIVERGQVAASPQGPAGRLEEAVVGAVLVLIDSGDDTLRVSMRAVRTPADGGAALVTTRARGRAPTRRRRLPDRLPRERALGVPRQPRAAAW